MFDKMLQTFSSPQAQEMVFCLIARQMAQAPPEKRAAMSQVTVAIVRKPRGLTLSIGESDDPQIAEIINSSLNGWISLL